MKKILVFGKTGQVSRALQKELPSETIFISRKEADFESNESLLQILELKKPSIVINAVAYTAVDKAESEEEKAMQINGTAPGTISQWCERNNALLIHFSTEYVYAGDGDKIQDENAPLIPINAYGLSKLKGEELIKQSGANYIILRTSWVYDEQGTNFVKTMLRLAAERTELKIVSDQFGSPTYAADLAHAVRVIITKAKKPIRESYNICGTGITTWFDFANEIFLVANEKGAKLKISNVLPILSDEYKTPAKRQLNSRISTTKLKRDFDLELPAWRESLRVCINKMEFP